MVGLLVGADMGFRINPNLHFQIGLAFSKQGAQQDADSIQTGLLQNRFTSETPFTVDSLPQPIILLDTGISVASKYNYLALPISLKFYPWENNGFFVEGGARLAYLLSAEVEGFRGEFNNNRKGINITDQIERFDFGILIGAGYKFRERVSFNLRYSQSFSNNVNTSNEKNVSSGSFRNRIYQATLSYYINR